MNAMTAAEDFSQQRQIAIGAGLQAREALQDIRADTETAIDQAQYHDRGETSDQCDRNGADKILQQQRVAVADIQRPHGPQCEVQGDRKIVPQAGDAIAHPGGCALAASRRANGLGDLPAALQDDDDDKEMHDQHHQMQQRCITGAMQAQQQRHIRKGDA